MILPFLYWVCVPASDSSTTPSASGVSAPTVHTIHEIRASPDACSEEEHVPTSAHEFPQPIIVGAATAQPDHHEVIVLDEPRHLLPALLTSRQPRHLLPALLNVNAHAARMSMCLTSPKISGTLERSRAMRARTGRMAKHTPELSSKLGMAASPGSLYAHHRSGFTAMCADLP